jgi:hypothetical protein
MDPPVPGATTATVLAGQTATYQLDVISMNAFAGSVAMACTGTPTATACSVTPSPVPVSANSTSVFQVNVATMARSTMLSPLRRMQFGPTAKLPFVLFAFAGLAVAWTLVSRGKATRTNRFGVRPVRAQSIRARDCARASLRGRVCGLRGRRCGLGRGWLERGNTGRNLRAERYGYGCRRQPDDSVNSRSAMRESSAGTIPRRTTQRK